MDVLADPCQDFSQWRVENKHEIPLDEEATGTRDLMIAGANSPKPAPGDVVAQGNLKKLQEMFSSCMDEKAILKAGRKPLADQIKRLTRILPAGESHSEKSNLSKAVGYIVKLGLQYPNSFISLAIDLDSQNPPANVLSISVYGPSLGNPDSYKDAELVKLNGDTIGAMFQIVLGDKDVGNRTQPLTPADSKQEWSDTAKTVIEFETRLAAIYFEPDEPSIQPITSPVSSRSLEELFQIDKVLQETSATALQHYFSWILIQNTAQNLSRPYHQPLVAFNIFIGITLKTDPKLERWKVCATIFDTNLGQIAGHYFIKEHFKGNSRQEVIKIIESIISSYTKGFSALTWLDKTTLEGTIKKAKAIALAVRYSIDSPDVTSSASLAEYYKDYNVDASSHFANQLRYYSWWGAKAFFQLPFRVNRAEYFTSSLTVNAFNVHQINAINLPAGILQKIYFNLENPQYLNYAVGGQVASHEIRRSFDSGGRLFDDVGRHVNWWNNVTAAAFREKTRCFMEQYGNFTIDGSDGKPHSVDGWLTLDENLADNTGIKMAYSA
ncbi:hypothetical protein BGW39_009656 [Mortierella sp. 14UC]|nr:hypothetical protein BGW39_009656 [Mortierella sp. 14UC]